MVMGEQEVVRFTLDGRIYELSRSEVEVRFAGVRPRSLGTHSVRVNGSWYPVRQAFEVATGLPPVLFNSHTARRHLANLGFEVRGEIQHRDASMSSSAGSLVQRAALNPAGGDADDHWYREALVQAAVVAALQAHGWHLVSQANTATKEHGIDVVATKDGHFVGIEVKGFPTTTYADPRRKAETKPTRPSTQASHWYSQAMLAAMRLRARKPEYMSVIALPDFHRYRSLFDETRSSLEAAGVRVWWVKASGAVEGLDGGT